MVANGANWLQNTWAWLHTTTAWPTDSASFWTMIQGIFVSASVFYAGAQFYFTRQSERRKLAAELSQKYFSGEPSPSQGAQTLRNFSPDTAAIINSGPILNAWVVLSNYVDTANTWLNFDMVDERLFMDHVNKLLSYAVLEYDKWKSVMLPDLLDSTMWEQMRKRVNKARKRYGSLPI